MFDFFKSITTNKGTSKRENDTSAKDKLSSTVNKAPVKENLNKTDKEKANISKFTSALTGELNSSEGVLSFQSNTDITGLGDDVQLEIRVHVLLIVLLRRFQSRDIEIGIPCVYGQSILVFGRDGCAFRLCKCRHRFLKRILRNLKNYPMC